MTEGDASIPARSRASGVAEASLLVQELPSTDALLTGMLTSVKPRTKDGLITCAAASERWGCKVSAHRDVLAPAGASVGDWLAFSAEEVLTGKPQASAPIWRAFDVGSKQRQVSVPFPPCVGRVSKIAPSGDCGTVESPKALQELGRGAVHVNRGMLLAGQLQVGDVIAFGTHLNNKGNPQVAPPVFKMCSRDPRSPQSPEHPQEAGGKNSTTTKSPFVKATTAAAASAEPLELPAPAASEEVMPWPDLPRDLLLGRLLASAGPEELSRLPTVCCAWSAALLHAEGQRRLANCWRALCWELFPTMAAKLDSTEDNGLEVATAAALEELRHSRGVRAHEEEEEEEVPAPRGSEEEAACAKAEARFWRQSFQQRHLKRLAWDADRLHKVEQKRRIAELHAQQVAVEDKRRGLKDGKGNLVRPVRTKVCRRCGMNYLPHSNTSDACRWHRGKYQRLDDDGIMVSQPMGVQQAIRANNRKKKSKQPNVMFPGMARAVGDESFAFAWSCCSADNMVASGCASGFHT